MVIINELEDLAMKQSLQGALKSLMAATTWILENAPQEPDQIAAVSVPYCRCFGIVAGGVMMLRSATIAEEKLKSGGDKEFYTQKRNTAKFYNTHILPQAKGYSQTVMKGAQSVLQAAF
jgi:hypothetical protein